MKKISKTNLELLNSLTDEEIDTSDIAPLDKSFFAAAKLRAPDVRYDALRKTTADKQSASNHASGLQEGTTWI